MELAKQSIEYKCSLDEEKYGRIKVLLKKRRDDNIIHPIHAAAAFLNLAYMLSDSFSGKWEMKEGISYIFDNLVSAEEKPPFLQQVQLYRMIYNPLFSSSAKAMLETYHPRILWDVCGDVLPVLQKYAIRILSQPCSSSSCERNWSAFEAAQTKKRNRLTPHMLGTLVYVRMNSMMMEKFQIKEVADVVPIDLSSLKHWPNYREEVEPISSGDLEGVSSNPNGLGNLESICISVVDDDDFDDDEEINLDYM